MTTKKTNNRKRGYTLIELLLALALTVVVSGLIGFLLQLYSNSIDYRKTDLREVEVARTVLNMIADDVRSVVRYKEFDAEALTTMLATSSGAAGAMGGAAGGATGGSTGMGGSSTGDTGSGATDTSSATASSATGAGMGGTSSAGGLSGGMSSGGTSGMSSGSTGTSAAGTTDLDATTTETVPTQPGIYGTQTSLMVDVSRLPRPDQYYLQNTVSMDGSLVDIPSDIKSVSYYVQANGVDGVRDTLSSGALATGGAMTGVSTGGLVRRQLDRAISTWAEGQGQMSQLMRTGELVAPEVVGLEFQYYDGTQWMTTWDSSTQSMPWMIQITIGIQDDKARAETPVQPGISLTMMGTAQLREYGVRVYQLQVAIPGAKLTTVETETTDEAGMEALGL